MAWFGMDWVRTFRPLRSRDPCRYTQLQTAKNEHFYVSVFFLLCVFFVLLCFLFVFSLAAVSMCLYRRVLYMHNATFAGGISSDFWYITDLPSHCRDLTLNWRIAFSLLFLPLPSVFFFSFFLFCLVRRVLNSRMLFVLAIIDLFKCVNKIHAIELATPSTRTNTDWTSCARTKCIRISVATLSCPTRTMHTVKVRATISLFLLGCDAIGMATIDVGSLNSGHFTW